METRSQVAQDIATLLGVAAKWEDTETPRIDETNLPPINWPRKLKPESTVVMDPVPRPGGLEWPLPRFEILVANLDSIGYHVVGTGRTPDGEFVQRAQWDMSREKNPLKLVALIRDCPLWIGHDTIWRHVAAALGVPQIVLNDAPLPMPELYPNTIVISPTDQKTESKALGPISVKEVAEAVVSLLKKNNSA